MKVKDLSTMLKDDQTVKFVSAFDDFTLTKWIDKFHDDFNRYNNNEVENMNMTDGLTFYIKDEKEYLLRVSNKVGGFVVIKREDDKLRLGQVLDVLDVDTFGVYSMDDTEYLDETSTIEEEERLAQVKRISFGKSLIDNSPMLVIETDWEVEEE